MGQTETLTAGLKALHKLGEPSVPIYLSVDGISNVMPESIDPKKRYGFSQMLPVPPQFEPKTRGGAINSLFMGAIGAFGLVLGKLNKQKGPDYDFIGDIPNPNISRRALLLGSVPILLPWLGNKRANGLPDSTPTSNPPTETTTPTITPTEVLPTGTPLPTEPIPTQTAIPPTETATPTEKPKPTLLEEELLRFPEVVKGVRQNGLKNPWGMWSETQPGANFPIPDDVREFCLHINYDARVGKLDKLPGTWFTDTVPITTEHGMLQISSFTKQDPESGNVTKRFMLGQSPSPGVMGGSEGAFLDGDNADSLELVVRINRDTGIATLTPILKGVEVPDPNDPNKTVKINKEFESKLIQQRIDQGSSYKPVQGRAYALFRVLAGYSESDLSVDLRFKTEDKSKLPDLSLQEHVISHAKKGVRLYVPGTMQQTSLFREPTWFDKLFNKGSHTISFLTAGVGASSFDITNRDDVDFQPLTAEEVAHVEAMGWGDDIPLLRKLQMLLAVEAQRELPDDVPSSAIIGVGLTGKTPPAFDITTEDGKAKAIGRRDKNIKRVVELLNTSPDAPDIPILVVWDGAVDSPQWAQVDPNYFTNGFKIAKENGANNLAFRESEMFMGDLPIPQYSNNLDNLKGRLAECAREGISDLTLFATRKIPFSNVDGAMISSNGQSVAKILGDIMEASNEARIASLGSEDATYPAPIGAINLEIYLDEIPLGTSTEQKRVKIMEIYEKIITLAEDMRAPVTGISLRLTNDLMTFAPQS